jgi:acyl carrier protein
VHLDHLPGSFFGPSNLVDLLRHRASHQGHDRAFTYLVDGETEEIHLTYQQLDAQARAVAARLQAANLEGERALLLYPAGLDFIAAFFGCLYAGVVAVPAYPPRRNRSLSRIQAIADDAEAKIALTTFPVWERVQSVLDQSPDLKIDWLCTDQLPEGAEDDWQVPDVHGDTLAFLQYTSGSTGTPKGVVLTHANLMHNSASIAYAFEHTRSGSGVFWLPSYHDMGLIGGILQPMYIGQANVLLSPMSFLQKPYRWLKAISKYRCTISGGPNFAYDLCVRKITPEQRDSLDLSRWCLAFNGAEPVRAETIDQFTRMFEPVGFRREAFYPCYGMAEATLIVSGGFRAALPVVRTFEAESLESNQVVDALADEEGVRELVGSGGNLLDQRIVVAHQRRSCPVTRRALCEKPKKPVKAAPPPSANTLEVVMHHVREIAKERATELSAETSIVELGLDSLERMEIIAALEETYGGRFPESELTQLETCGDVAQAVEPILAALPQRADFAGEVLPEHYRFGALPRRSSGCGRRSRRSLTKA